MQFIHYHTEIRQQSSGGGGHSGIAPRTKYCALNAFKSSSLHRNGVILLDRAPSVEVRPPADEGSSEIPDIDITDGVLLTCVDLKGLADEPNRVDGVVEGFVGVGLDANGPEVFILKIEKKDCL